MSFNTSNISCDSIIGNVSLSAPIHYVDGVPLSKNEAGNLNLGDENNNTVNCLILDAKTLVSAPTGILPTVSTSEIIPLAGIGNNILVDGYTNYQNYGLLNVNSITLNNGATGSNQLLGCDSSNNLQWVNPQPAGDASQWANYPAISNVDLSTYSITGTTGSFSNMNIYNTGDTGAYYNISYGLSTEEPTLPSILINPPQQYSYMSLMNSMNWELVGDGSLIINNGRMTALNIRTPNNSFVADTNANSLVSSTAMNISGFGNISCTSLNPLFKFVNDFFVCPNGDDLNSGSPEAPFQTIQHALNIVSSLTLLDGQIRSIHVMTGSYNENLTISSKVYLLGIGSSLNNTVDGTQINGTITINISNVEQMNQNTVNISGFLINGTILYTSSQNATLNMNNCYIYSFNDTSGRCLYFNPTSTDCRLRLDSCKFISGGSIGLNPLLEITTKSLVSINNCDFTAKGQQNCLLFSGNSNCDVVANSRFDCSFNSPDVLALVKITATSSSTYTFNNCGFVYSTTSDKSNNGNASGIQSYSAIGNNQIVVLYCSFFLIGTNKNTNYAVQDQYHSLPSQMVVLYYMNGASINNAFAINANNNQNKFQLQIVS